MGAIETAALDREYARRCIRAIPWPLPNVWLGTSVERDREMNARSLADTEFLAREMAAIRLSLERKADRDDVVDAMNRLT